MINHKQNVCSKWRNRHMHWRWQAAILKYGLLSQMLSESNQGALAAYGVWGEGWVVGYYCWGVKSKGHSLYGDERGMKVAPRPSQMIHSLPWPLTPGLTSLLFSLLTVYCRAPLARRVQVYPVHGKNTAAIHVFTCSFANTRVCRHTHVCLIHGCTLMKHVCKRQMSKVHCGTLLTSNVTNNFFLQLHCSNPFSGFWNGNIITFLWCSAFDKTAACWAECLTELDASPKPSPLSTLFLSLTHSAPSLLLPFLLSPPIALSVISKNSFCLSLSLSLTRPGIAVDKRGVVYFVDGTTIQKINERGLLSTVIGSNGLMSTQPLSCDARMDISQVS